MTEPVLHIRKIKDPSVERVVVELDEDSSQYCVTSPERIEWLDAIEAVSSYLELRERKGRDD